MIVFFKSKLIDITLCKLKESTKNLMICRRAGGNGTFYVKKWIFKKQTLKTPGYYNMACTMYGICSTNIN